MEVPPVLIRDGGVIRDGFNQELDELRDLANGATASLARIEERERLLTGINTLKVGYNKVHGFYIEVSRANSHLVPAHYIRRQTLKNNERYIIDELKSTRTRCSPPRPRRWRWKTPLRRAARCSAAAPR